MNKKSEAAKLLGSIKSKKKAMAARLNGLMPCAPGKKRGRPRKDVQYDNQTGSKATLRKPRVTKTRSAKASKVDSKKNTQSCSTSVCGNVQKNNRKEI